MGIIKGSRAVFWPPSQHRIDLLAIEVDEVEAVDVIVGTPGRVWYPVSPLEQL